MKIGNGITSMASTTPTAEKSVNNGNAFSLAPKLTQAQCERERKGRKIQTLKTDVIRLGFHAQEVDKVFASTEIEKLLLLLQEEDDDATVKNKEGENHNHLRPLTLWNGALLKQLIARVEEESSSEEDDKLAADQGTEGKAEEEELREEEMQVLEAIYAEGFQLLSNNSGSSSSSSGVLSSIENNNLRYRVEVTPTQPLHMANSNDESTNINNICHLYVIANRRGYPLSSPPMIWFTNSTLPEAFLRRINIKLHEKARELSGQPAVYDLMEYAAEGIADWQVQYMKEEGLSQERIERSDSEEYAYQRKKLRADGKPYAHNDVLIEQQRLTDETNKRRQEQVRFEMETMTSRLAGNFLHKQMNERVKEEVDAAGRRAMNDALCRGEGRDEARKAAEDAEEKMRKFHGLK